jgi:hypothetical protein
MPNDPKTKSPDPLTDPMGAALHCVDTVMARRIFSHIFNEEKLDSPMFYLFKRVYAQEFAYKRSVSELAEFIGVGLAELSSKLVEQALAEKAKGANN